jgi:hypothetical protein
MKNQYLVIFLQSLLKFLIKNCMVRILIFCIFMVIKVKQLFKVASLFPTNGVKWTQYITTNQWWAF